MIRLEVWGDFASFNNPALKVERFTYDIMTPSAARNILQSIYWHPSFDWVIDKIYILNPIKKIRITRNEINKKCNYNDMKNAAYGKSPLPYISIRDNNIRTQRSSMMLKDVRYVIEAHFVKKPNSKEKFDENKICAIFCERAKKGKCFNTPFLGTRECSASFRLLDNNEQIKPINYNNDLGIILYDMNYEFDNITPYFFHAIIKNGILDLTQCEVIR